MTHRPLEYTLQIEDRSFPLREVRGREALSEPFSVEVRLASPDPFLSDPDALLRLDAVVRMARPGSARTLGGIVMEASVEGVIRGAPEIAIVIEPRLALARHRRDSRVFRDRAAPQIVTEVLAPYGITPALRLAAGYATRPYCVQYAETDLAFVSRLLEDEGIFYFFLEDGGLVLGDSPAAWEPIAGVRVLPFVAASGHERPIDAVIAVGERGGLTAGRTTLRDFAPVHPRLDMDVGAPVPGGPSLREPVTGPEWYDYPGGYQDPSEGARKARIIAESFGVSAAAYAGRSTSALLSPGVAFELVGAPVGDGARVITSVEHDWDREGGDFVCGFEGFDAEAAYRPARRTPRPVHHGVMTGFVTTPPGADDIHTDASGRVKLHFHWDRLMPYDDTCSDWVPMPQDNTGHSSSIPRRGWEMLVHFLEGDPDRPVVLGRVYNATDPFPAALPEAKTQTALRSLTTPSRDGNNEIRIDDASGRELFSSHAQKDQHVTVAHDKQEDVGRHEGRTVVRDATIAVGNDHRATIGQEVQLEVQRDQTVSTAGDRSIQVAKTHEVSVAGDHALTIGGSHSRRIASDDTVQAARLSETVGAVIVETSLQSNTTTAGLAGALLVGGAAVEVARKDKSEVAELARVETVGGLVMSTAGGAMEHQSLAARTTTVGGALVVTAGGDVNLSGTEGVLMTSSLISLSGDQSLGLKVGGSVVLLKDGLLSVESRKITVKISGNNTLGS